MVAFLSHRSLFLCVLLIGFLSLSSCRSEVTDEPGTPSLAPEITAFTATPETGSAPFETTFAWTIQDPEGDLLTCILDAGDGSVAFTLPNCTSATRQSHRYEEVGSYTAVLKVSDTSRLTVRRLQLDVNPPDVTPTPPEPEPQEVKGLLENYEMESGQLRAEVIDTRINTVVSLAATDIGLLGDFTLLLPSTVDEALLQTFIEADDPCLTSEALTVTPDGVQKLTPNFAFYEDGVPQGIVLYTSTADETERSVTTVQWRYVNESVTVEGTCENETYSLRLDPGWNTVFVTQTEVDGELFFAYTNGPVTDTLSWFLFFDGGS